MTSSRSTGGARESGRRRDVPGPVRRQQPPCFTRAEDRTCCRKAASRTLFVPALGTSFTMLGNPVSTSILDQAVEGARLMGNAQTLALYLFNRASPSRHERRHRACPLIQRRKPGAGRALRRRFGEVLGWCDSRPCIARIGRGRGERAISLSGNRRSRHSQHGRRLASGLPRGRTRCCLEVGEFDEARSAAQRSRDIADTVDSASLRSPRIAPKHCSSCPTAGRSGRWTVRGRERRPRRGALVARPGRNPAWCSPERWRKPGAPRNPSDRPYRRLQDMSMRWRGRESLPRRVRLRSYEHLASGSRHDHSGGCREGRAAGPQRSRVRGRGADIRRRRTNGRSPTICSSA